MSEHILLRRAEAMPGLLSGAVTQIRVPVKSQPIEDTEEDSLDGNLLGSYRVWEWQDETFDDSDELCTRLLEWCPFGVLGDRLIVKEPWDYLILAWHKYDKANTNHRCPADHDPVEMYYRADGILPPVRWRSAATMPHWASRLTLLVVEVKVQRLHEATEEEICAELGAPETWPGPGKEPYHRDLHGSHAFFWDARYPHYSWASNPWTWVAKVAKVRKE